MPAGRPKEYDVNDIIEQLNIYIGKTAEPLIQEFALKYDIPREYLYQLAYKNEELSYTIKKAINKQEVYLLRNASKRTIDPTFTMFRLKQPCFGYKDKQEVESHNTNENLNYNIEDSTERKKRIEELLSKRNS